MPRTKAMTFFNEKPFERPATDVLTAMFGGEIYEWPTLTSVFERMICVAIFDSCWINQQSVYYSAPGKWFWSWAWNTGAALALVFGTVAGVLLALPFTLLGLALSLPFAYAYKRNIEHVKDMARAVFFVIIFFPLLRLAQSICFLVGFFVGTLGAITTGLFTFWGHALYANGNLPEIYRGGERIELEELSVEDIEDKDLVIKQYESEEESSTHVNNFSFPDEGCYADVISKLYLEYPGSEKIELIYQPEVPNPQHKLLSFTTGVYYLNDLITERLGFDNFPVHDRPKGLSTRTYWAQNFERKYGAKIIQAASRILQSDESNLAVKIKPDSPR